MKEKIKHNHDERWRLEYKNLPVHETSGFYLAYLILRPKEKTNLDFKNTKCELSSCLSQVLTGHGYTGEYYAKMNIPNPTSCPCDHETFQTRDHLIRYCLLYNKSRDQILMPAFPHLQNPQFSLGSLF